MKKIICIIFTFALIMLLTTPAYADKVNINIDGSLDANNTEWNGLESIVLQSGSATQCEFDVINEKYYVDEKSQIVYFLFVASSNHSYPVSDEEMEKISMEFTPTGCEPIKFYYDKEKDSDVKNGYKAEKNFENKFDYYGVMTVDQSSATVFCEIKINYKDGIPNPITGTLRVTDRNGNANNTINLYNEAETKTETTTKKEKTTKSKTTAEEETERTRRNSTIKKTIISTTTRADKTKKETTTKEEKTQVITSVIEIATTKPQETTFTESSVLYDAQVNNSTEITQNTSEITDEKSAFGLKNMPKSTLYKVITGISALILFGVIGVWAVKSKSDD